MQLRTLTVTSCILAVTASCSMAADNAKGVWTNPAGDLPASFAIQGEYTGQYKGGEKLGCQVIALGGDSFQAVLYPGGLPGEGWDGKNRSLMAGHTANGTTTFAAATGNRRYLAGPADQFSASQSFPPEGHQAHSGTLVDGVLTGKNAAGKAFELKRVVRKSRTQGKQPERGATILFDGSNADHFRGGRLDEKTKLLNTDGKDILTKDKFNNYHMHIEFMLPYRPDARGQGRGNSGFYQVDHYEVQVLDSFGLEGLDNECGGVYQKARPSVNMCYPPLTWQTYDVEFHNAVVENGKKVRNARMTLFHNGVKIYDNLEINGKTGGSRGEPEGTPGPIKLQGHGNPLQYRNIWISELK